MEGVGMKITTFKETFTKSNIGFRMGLSNTFVVLFGLFAVKLVNIPMYELYCLIKQLLGIWLWEDAQ